MLSVEGGLVSTSREIYMCLFLQGFVISVSGGSHTELSILVLGLSPLL